MRAGLLLLLATSTTTITSIAVRKENGEKRETVGIKISANRK